MKRLLLLLTCLSFVACGQLGDLLDKDGGSSGEENVSGGEDEGKEDDDSGNGSLMTVSGYAQKGQFSSGSQVTIFGLNENLEPNGDSWPSNIKDASGAFSLSVEEGAPYMEVRAQGYYFDEVNGGISDGMMTLEAIVDSSSDRVNVNLLTHLVRPRIKNLMSEGCTYSEARTQAERELVTSLGYSPLDISFDQLDITRSREGDALLLALACTLQYGRSTGEMVTLINGLSLDFETDGNFEENNLAAIEAAMPHIDIMQVYENMHEYYQENNMAEAVVPDFYRYLLDEDAFMVEGPESDEVNLSREGGEFEWYVVSMIDFKVESDVDWIEVAKEHVIGPQYKITVHVAPNDTMEDRTGKIVFNDAQDNVKAEYDILVLGPYAILTCVFENDTKSLIMDDSNNLNFIGEDRVDVNGENYPFVGEGSWFTVRTRPASSYVVSYPADAVEVLLDGTYSVNYPSEVCNNTYGVVMGKTEGTECILESINALVKVDLSNYPDWTHVELNVGEAVICGKAVISSDYIAYNVMSVNDGSSTVRVNRSGDESIVYIPVIPCTGNGLTLTVFYADGKSYSRTSSNPVSVSRRHILSLGVFPNPQ